MARLMRLNGERPAPPGRGVAVPTRLVRIPQNARVRRIIAVPDIIADIIRTVAAPDPTTHAAAVITREDTTAVATVITSAAITAVATVITSGDITAVATVITSTAIMAVATVTTSEAIMDTATTRAATKSAARFMPTWPR